MSCNLLLFHTTSIRYYNPRISDNIFPIFVTATYAEVFAWNGSLVNNSSNEFKNCPTKCDLFSLLYFCRQLYMFRVVTPIIRSSYNYNYSFWYWLTGSTTIRSGCLLCNATYSVYYISVGSSTCFGWWHPSSEARTTVIIASGID
jgi:hypothetical protein